MKEEINLLPPDVQHTRILGLYGKRAAGIYMAVAVALVLVGIGYASSWGVLKFTLRNITQSLADVEAVGSDKATRALNTRIQFIHQRLIEHPAFILDVADALAIAPSGVVITSIEINDEEQTVHISGRANTRSAIVQFEEKLHEQSWVETIDAPLQNFASGPNVTFQFTIKRKI